MKCGSLAVKDGLDDATRIRSAPADPCTPTIDRNINAEKSHGTIHRPSSIPGRQLKLFKWEIMAGLLWLIGLSKLAAVSPLPQYKSSKNISSILFLIFSREYRKNYYPGITKSERSQRLNEIH